MSTPEKPFSGSTEEGLPPTGRTDEEELEAARAANRFDIRRIIGYLFTLYGVILVVIGIVGTSEIKNKADGVNVNLWTGIGMLLFAAFMLIWAFTRPVAPEPPETRGEGSGRLRRAPA